MFCAFEMFRLLMDKLYGWSLAMKCNPSSGGVSDDSNSNYILGSHAMIQPVQIYITPLPVPASTFTPTITMSDTLSTQHPPACKYRDTDVVDGPC